MTRGHWRRVAALGFAVALGLVGAPAPGAFAASAGATIDLADAAPPASGDGWTYANGLYTVLDGANVLVTGVSTGDRLVVAPGAVAFVTLQDATIDVSATEGACPFDMTGATVDLTLVGSSTLNSGYGRAALQAPDGAVLTIGGSGALTAAAPSGNNGGGGSGIGGGDGAAGGAITINDGTVTATGATYSVYGGAGIGGGAGAAGGVTTINGGIVTATGGPQRAAGIGGGTYGAGGNITINGGAITAKAGYSAAGVGGGYSGAGGNITINGGEVTATDLGASGTGIGVGRFASGGVITINGGTVKAASSGGGAGIGGSHSASVDAITINGGDVTASSSNDGAGIGGGYSASVGAITINGGAITASSGGNGAGIGGGQNAAAGTITINGGAVTASSRNNGAGIGGGQNGAGGAVTITGGTVTATKGSSSNRGDIGPGGNGADGTVTITGGSVKSGSGALPVPQPQDAQSNPVYLVVLTLDSAGDGATVVASQITGEPYGVQDVVTRDGGKVYAWLSDTTTAGGIVLGTNTADYSAPDTTPVGAGNGAAFTLRASPSTAAVNGGTVQMNLNGGRWRGQGWRISVRSETDGKSATAVDNGDSTVSVTGFAGTYAVHDIGQDTGITLTLDAGDPGSARLDYYQPGDGDYDLTPTTAVYDGSQQPVTVSGKTSIGQNAGTLTVYYTGTGATDYAQSTDAPISAGTYAVTVDVAEGPWAAGVKYLAAEGVAVGDYTIAKAPQSGFALTDLAGSYTYGDASFTVGTSGGLGTGAVTYEVVEGDAASVDLNSGEVTILSAGTFKIKATIAESELYEAGSVTSAPVTVAKATPRVVLTANPADGSVFGGSVVLTAVVIGAGGGAQPTGAVTFEVDGQAVTGGADLPLSGGRAEFTVTGLTTGEHSFEALYSGSADYQAETATLSGYETAKAEQAPVVITPPGTKTYGDAPFTLGIGTSGSGTGAVVFSAPANDCVDVSAAGAVRIKGAGSVVVTATKDTDADYNQASGTLTLTIEPRDIGQVSVTVTGQTTYTGAQLTPAFTVDDGTQAITDGDYTVTWGENVNVATGGSLTLRGHGNYTGGKTQAFPIGAAALSVAEAPQASSVLADEGLAGSVLSGGSVEFGGTPVTGVFAWADPAAQVTPGQEHDAVFTPDAVYGGNFAPVHLRVAVAVKDALAGGLAAAEAVAWGGVNTTTAWTDFAAAKAAANQALTDPSAAQARLDAAAAALAAALAALRVDDDSHGFEGGVSRHVIGGGDLTHLSTHDWSLHTGVVKVDGVTLTLGAQYSSAEGSTVTTLLGSYLDTLAVGEHVLEVEFSSGIAPVKDVFTVAAAATPTPTPTPGQGGNDALSTTGPVSASWLVAALAVTAAGLWLLVGSRRRAAQGQPGG